MDVPGPIVRFAEFAIADDVYPYLRLLMHHFRDRFAQASRMCGLIVRLAALNLAQKRHELWRPDQTSNMRRQNSILTGCHGDLRTRTGSRPCCKTNLDW